MSDAVDWDSAPKWAMHYADGKFWHFGGDKWHWFRASSGEWIPTIHSPYEFKNATNRPAPQEKPADAPAEPTNKYDRTITGKYSTGKCTIDVYRVLSAYDVTDSEVAHAVKKLLAPGQRGVKEERQDIEEAIQSLQAWIARMDDEGVK